MADESEEIKEYFTELTQKTENAYEIAKRARAKGYDPERTVDIPVARNMAERVEGLMSAVAPQLVGKGMISRIQELEAQYGRLSWQVALVIAKEVAEEKFCSFRDKKEAMEVGIRAGFTYHTVGIVSAPLEGFVELKLKKRKDGKEYFALSYAGPIRGAGGTAAAVSLIIADYVRTMMQYEAYDSDEQEQNRAYTELQDYHERVTRLQYNPSEAETRFLMKHLPVEIDGDPTETIDVSNYKDIPRIETNKIRGGFCLVLSMVALKSSKLWAELGKWGKTFGLDWTFLDEFLHLQKEKKAKKTEHETTEDKPKILPDYTFVTDLVAGRPVLTHPLSFGGFRLRYGRSRVSGYSAASISPLTSFVLHKFVATGTQFKTERPGKSASITFCDTLEGPLVKLHTGDVVMITSETEAKKYADQIIEILFLGDILFSYGDFLDRNHILIPVGYCEEWWIQEVEKKNHELFGTLDLEKEALLLTLPLKRVKELHNTFLYQKPSFEESLLFSTKMSVPLHPLYCFHWNGISSSQLLLLLAWFQKATISYSREEQKIVLPLQEEKRYLELIGVPHLLSTEFVVLQKDVAISFLYQTGLLEKKVEELMQVVKAQQEKTSFDLICMLSLLPLRDKSGTFIGARMGRPEKAKMRKLTGSPHVLFPVGAEGGRLRSFQAALAEGKITADFPNHLCPQCRRDTPFAVCEACDVETLRLFFCATCGLTDKKCMHTQKTYQKRALTIKKTFEACLLKYQDTHYPDLIKGVRGTSNKDHTPEHLLKGILRAKHDVYVNKDGTTRYDMTELPITHFKPREIGTTVETLRILGYTKDIRGLSLVNEDQILELKPQDAILPAAPESTDEPADAVLFRVAQFVDELLVKLYGEKPFYQLSKKEELVGHLVIGLAPHISAGILGRIIGFSKTQGCFGHPLWHAAHRRDCDGDENCVMLLMDALLNFSRQYLPNKRGAKTMDAPLVLTAILRPAEVDDMVHKLDIAWQYPLDLYEAAMQYKSPRDVKIDKLGAHLGTEKQYEGMGFTHDTADFNTGIKCSAYKTLPSMEEKLKGQMLLAEKIRAVDAPDVARLVIEKHFLKDIKGNLRKFSMQKFRCVKCNQSFRRPPLTEKCTSCGGNVIFTISEGSILKYLEPSISLAKKYAVSPYLKQTLELTKNRVEGVFGKEREKQAGLGDWFGAA